MAHYHLMGIGGIGMSALARLISLYDPEAYVTGSDCQTDSPILSQLRREGITISTQEGSLLRRETIVIYSTSIASENKEMQRARKVGVTQFFHRATFLQRFLIQRGRGKLLAVTGTHGKTTTSALLVHILSQKQPLSYAIGGILNSRKKNGEWHKNSPYFILEADESDGSFLEFSPHIAIVTNMEQEHLENYSHFADLQNTFARFIQRVHDFSSEKYPLIWCYDDPHLRNMHFSMNFRGISYGFHPESMVQITSYQQKGWKGTFSLKMKMQKRAVYRDIHLPLPTKEHALNATAAFVLALQMGMSERTIRFALQTFSGVERRLEWIGQCKRGTLFFDDYAHHPTEIEATLRGVRNAYPQRRLIAVFQPHRYTRLEAFFSSFTTAFRSADKVFVSEVYAASESPQLATRNVRELSQKIQLHSSVSCTHLPLEEIEKKLAGKLKSNDLLITLGAGNVTTLSHNLFHTLS